MRRILLIVLLIMIWMSSCTKTKTTTNNYSILPVNAQPAFAINGITDLTFINNFEVVATMPLTVQYLDSTQQNVSLSLSGMPAGITLDTTWIHNGFPTFSTTLSLADTVISGGTVPGKYPLTLTASTPSGEQKTFTFNLTVSCAGNKSSTLVSLKVRKLRSLARYNLGVV